MSLIVKLLIVALLGYFVIWPWLRRRWPDFTRRINFALVASLFAIILFRVLVKLSRKYFAGDQGAATDSAPVPPPSSLPETSGRP